MREEGAVQKNCLAASVLSPRLPFSLPTLLRPLPPHCLSSRSRASVLSCTPRKACTSPSSRPKSSGRQRPSSLRSAGTCKWEAPSVQSLREQG